MKDIYSNYSSNSSLGSLVNDPTNEYNLGYPIIGNDESGKGDFFGSLVVASVYLDQKAGNLLAKNGIQDSKNLTDKKILTLESTIKKYCYGKFSIVEITPERYNQLYDKFKNEGKNLNMLLAWAHARSLENLLNKVDCKRAIIDKFSGEDLVVGYLQEKGRSIDIIQKYKAENNIAVAAASILARAQFVKRISMLEEEYGVKLYKGASAKVISSAKEFVKKHSRKDLKNIAKLHFKTYEKI
ncbi:MAG: ribonuclease HIII [Candidatus Cloacimonadota bacterium]|nr:MAG: ribonuclease HIII [Candidatus Cloacimonadota bacterium]PIE79772.1 MAG: ribonuclease HIII [Candidatus Delongbacteria bacterium]